MGKKKDKLYKLEPETKAMIAAVRSAVEDWRRHRAIRSVYGF